MLPIVHTTSDVQNTFWEYHKDTRYRRYL